MIRAGREEGAAARRGLRPPRSTPDRCVCASRRGQAGASAGCSAATAPLKILRTMDYFRANGGWRGTRRWTAAACSPTSASTTSTSWPSALGIPAQGAVPILDAGPRDRGGGPRLRHLAVRQRAGGHLLRDHLLPAARRGTSASSSTGRRAPSSRRADGPFDEADRRGGSSTAPGRRSRPTSVVEPPVAESPRTTSRRPSRTGAPLVCAGRDGRRSRAVLDAMYTSACERKRDWVTPPEWNG